MRVMKFIFLLLVFLNALFAQENSNIVVNAFGFVQPIYEWQPTNDQIPNNSFLINRFRIGLDSKFSNWVKTEIELDPLDKNLIKDANINFELNQYLSLSLGRQKMPFSRERLTSVKNIQYFERTKVVKEFDDLAYAGRDIGLIASLNTKVKTIRISFSAGIFNGNKGDLNGDYNNSKTYVQRLELNHKDFSIGINSAQKFDSLTSKYFVANGFDFEVELINNLKFSSEFLIGRKNANSLLGGEYIALEYTLDKFIFGVRFSQFYSNIKKKSTNYFEAKTDYKPAKTIKISLNWLGENKSSKFNNKFVIGVSYVL